MAKASNIYHKDPEFPTGGVDDMTRLAYLHEPGVLQNLACRYEMDEIYVRTEFSFCSLLFLSEYLPFDVCLCYESLISFSFSSAGDVLCLLSIGLTDL